MSKIDKLKQKLQNGSIDAKELRRLMKQMGAVLDRTVGSHEQWIRDGKVMTLATHSNDLKLYQFKAAKEFLNG